MTTLLNSIKWNYGIEGVYFSAVVSAVGIGLESFVGGFDGSIRLLLILMAVDLFTGVIAAIKVKSLRSNIMFWGGVNKVFVLIFVGIGAGLDLLLSGDSPVIRAAIIWFYIGRELLSLVENSSKIGVIIPPVILEIINQLPSSDEKED